MRFKNIAFSILLTVFVFTLYYLTIVYCFPDMASRGQFGDVFGCINAFFTALAFLGVVYTILQQNKIINQTSDQLAQSKIEFEVQHNIQALTTLIKVYERKLSQTVDHFESNKIKAKINELTQNLETALSITNK